ncbi:hypothetical protein GQ54DRAFT_159166 [Martensiomyces pterosporus]|nr:hypothetical protein GQ54DRAFT_159166 [Martensiomyces pterosporus]
MSEGVEYVEDDVISPTSQKIREVTLYTVLGIYTLFVLVTFALFVRQSMAKQGRDLAKRSVALLVAVQTAGEYIVGILGLSASARTDLPCVAKLWMLNFGLMLLSLGILARACQLIVTSRVHMLHSMLTADTAEACRTQAAPAGGVWQRRTIDSQPSERNIEMDCYLGQRQSGGNEEFAHGMQFDSQLATTPQASLRSNNSGYFGTQSENKGAICRRLRKYARVQKYTTDRFLLLTIGGIMTCVFIMTLVFTFTCAEYAERPLRRQCHFTYAEYPVIVAISVFLVIICPFLLSKVWRLNDAYGIKNDLIICVTLAVFNLTLAMIWETKLPRLRLILSGLFYAFLSALAMHITSVVFPLVRSWRVASKARMMWPASYTSSVDITLLINGDQEAHMMAEQRMFGVRADTFFHILEDPMQFETFCKFAAQSFCSELTAFISEYQALKRRTLNAFTRLQNSKKSESASNIKDLYSEFPSVPTDRPFVAGDDALRGPGDSILGKIFGKRPSIYSVAGPANLRSRVGGQTSIKESILDTLRTRMPLLNLTSSSQFPPSLERNLRLFVNMFIRPEAEMAVNLPGSVVDAILMSMDSGNLHLTLLDRAKDETLKLLYTDVYVRYASRPGSAK